MDFFLFSILFLGLTIIYLLIGIKASKGIKDTTDYFLAGRQLGFVSATSTLIATHLGGGMLIGTSQQAYNIGIWGILYTAGIVAGFLMLGLGLASRLQSLNISTIPEIFKKRYNAPSLARIASLLSIATLCALLVGQVIASRSLIDTLGFSNQLPFIIFWVLIIAYTVAGGLNAVVLTDVFQVALIILMFSGIFIYCLYQDPSSIKSLVTYNPGISWKEIARLSPILTMTALFALIEEDLAQRFFACKSKFIASASALTAGAFMILFSLIPIYMGIQAKLQGLNVPMGGSPLIPFMEANVSGFVQALALCAIIAAITSTADSLLCAISSNISQDFDLGFMGIKSKLTRSKVVSLIVGIGAFAASYLVGQNVIDVLVSGYEISVSTLLVPIVASMFVTKLKSRAAKASMAVGFLLFFIFKLYPVPFSGLITLAISGLVFALANR